MSDKKEPRVIKRYANRKLYDMTESCYITHEEIAALVRDGEEVRIVDNRTKEDLTSATLTQILLDEEKRVKKPLPIDTLRNFFTKTSGEFIQRHIKTPVANLRDEAEKNVRRVLGGIRRDEKGGLEPEPPPAPVPPPQAVSAAQASLGAGGSKAKPGEALRDAIEERWNEFQSYVAQFDFPRRIAELEQRVAQLEGELAEARGELPPGTTAAAMERANEASKT